MNENYDITTIEETVQEIVRNLSVSAKVYGNRPKAVAESVSDFVVVKVSGPLVDEAAYGRCRIAIYLFARDVNNVKNKKKLSVMYRTLAAGFPTAAGNLLITGTPTIIGDTPDDYGFHARVIQYNNVIVKSV